ncbi:MAG: sigma-54-dependent transcriptional regulator [Nitrospinota bacterium]
MDKNKKSVLVVDDDKGIRNLLQCSLEEEFNVYCVEGGNKARDFIERQHVDVVLLDIRLPDTDGITILKEIKSTYIDVEVIVISGGNDLQTAIEAMKNGAFDYVAKTFDVDDLRMKIKKVIEALEKKKEMFYLKGACAEHLGAGFVVGESVAMKTAFDLAKKVAKYPTTALILGESGTGKEVLAQAIWKESGAVGAPFIPVNVASIPPELIESHLFGHEKGAFTGAYRQNLGKFELASNGFIFLDEIGDLRMDLQAKLLRTIQEGTIERVGGNKIITVNARLIAATNADLEDMVRKREFREDLYYRLKIVPIELPPLRERPEDIPVLANFFLEKYRRKFNKQFPGAISDEAMELLRRYKWPGNIRELENLMEKSVVLGDEEVLLEKDIPVELQVSGMLNGSYKKTSGGKSVLDRAVRTFEKNLIVKTLKNEGWSRTKASEALGIPSATFKYKLRLHDIYKYMDEKKV